MADVSLDKCLNQRIDNVLLKTYPRLPRSLIYRLLRTGDIKVNHKKVPPSYKVGTNDFYSMRDYWHSQGQRERSKIILPKVDIETLENNRSFIIINKPYGIPVHQGTNYSYGIIDYFTNFYLIHRLDCDVSGCLILSSELNVVRKFHVMFKEHLVSKRYLAVVFGKWPIEVTRINLPLDHKPAETFVRVMTFFDHYTVLEITIATGRKRQIRKHLAMLGHPILGDRKFYVVGSKAFPRLFLHAENISFTFDSIKYDVTASSCALFQQYLSGSS